MKVTDEMVRAAIASRARDDEGEFEMLGDLLGFSGENKTRTVVRAALEAAMTSSLGADLVGLRNVYGDENVDLALALVNALAPETRRDGWWATGRPFEIIIEHILASHGFQNTSANRG